MDEFGKRVRLIRQRLHLTQQGLGDRLGLTKVSVARHEAGRIPRLDLLQKIAAIAGANIAWLLHGEATSSGREPLSLFVHRLQGSGWGVWHSAGIGALK